MSQISALGALQKSSRFLLAQERAAISSLFRGAAAGYATKAESATKSDSRMSSEEKSMAGKTKPDDTKEPHHHQQHPQQGQNLQQQSSQAASQTRKGEAVSSIDSGSTHEHDGKHQPIRATSYTDTAGKGTTAPAPSQQTSGSSSSSSSSADGSSKGSMSKERPKANPEFDGPMKSMGTATPPPPTKHERLLHANAFEDQRGDQRPYSRRNDAEENQGAQDTRNPYRDDGKGQVPATDRRDRASFTQQPNEHAGRTQDQSTYKHAAPIDTYHEPGSVRGEAAGNSSSTQSPSSSSSSSSSTNAAGHTQRRGLHTFAGLQMPRFSPLSLAAARGLHLTVLGPAGAKSASTTSTTKAESGASKEGSKQLKQSAQSKEDHQPRSGIDHTLASPMVDGASPAKLTAHPSPARAQQPTSGGQELAEGQGLAHGNASSSSAPSATASTSPSSSSKAAAAAVGDKTASGHRTGGNARSANPYGDQMDKGKDPFARGNYPYVMPSKERSEAMSDVVPHSPLARANPNGNIRDPAAQAAVETPAIVMSTGPATIPGLQIAPIDVHGREEEPQAWHPAAADQMPTIGIPVEPAEPMGVLTDISTNNSKIPATAAQVAAAHAQGHGPEHTDKLRETTVAPADKSKQLISKLGLKKEEKAWRPEEVKQKAL